MSQNGFCSCPECAAVLRLTAAQLEHTGLVRCGACEKTFLAVDHRVMETESGFVPWKSGGLQDEEGPENHSMEQSVSPEITESSGKSPSGKPRSHETQPDDPYQGEHSAGAEDPLTDPLPDPDGETSQSPEIRNPFAEDGETSGNRVEAETDRPGPDPAPGETGTREDNRLFRDNDYVTDFDRAHYETFSASDDSRDQPESRSGSHGESFPGSHEAGVDPFSEKPPSSEASLGIDRSEVDQYIVDQPNPLVTFTWFLVIAGFVFLLGLQVKYFFVEKYAQNEHYRPYLELFCKVAACDLPPQKNLYGFTLTHTKIDLHPTQPGAMRLMVKLVNEAEFEQAYPALQLTFTDRVGRVVGRRTFGPGLYLPKETENRIGRGEYVTILFDLARPHGKAVGFVVDIVTEPVS